MSQMTANMSAAIRRRQGKPRQIGNTPLVIAVALLLVASFVVFRPAIAQTLKAWLNSPEYNYGPIIPFIAAAMLWRDLRRATAQRSGGWIGVVIVFLSFTLGIAGTFASFIFLSQVGLLCLAIGLFVVFQGERRALQVWPGLVYLGFGLPLTNLILFNLSSQLQLISSSFGAFLIRIFGISVFLEGNVIDLGQFQLQVVEACSGLRYLFPLASFAFLCAYLFRAPMWQRVVVFLSSVPITIGMNSLRIAVTGLLVDRIGIEAAQGFFHDFEGWLIFCGCVAVLLLEIKMLCLIGHSNISLIETLDFNVPPKPGRIGEAPFFSRTLGAGVVISILSAAVIAATSGRTEVIPSRSDFASFPLWIAGWQIIPASIDQDTLDLLHPTDYLSAYATRDGSPPIGVWIPYYASQQLGGAAHSPRTCLPGGGWQIDSFSDIGIEVYGKTITANRVIISRGSQKSLVYYWFQGRGRVDRDESIVKWHIMSDGMIRNRTDGALVRFVSPIDNRGPEYADHAIQVLIKDMWGPLSSYIPD